MDQRKIGIFMAQLRKQKGWTQMQLAELLGVTNKTVSRWETGHYMPDLATLPLLCQLLEISINEFLAGERLQESEFRRQADENVVNILNMEVTMKKQQKWMSAMGGAGTGLLFSAVYAPQNTARTVIVIIGIIMILASWFLQDNIIHKLTNSKTE